MDQKLTRARPCPAPGARLFRLAVVTAAAAIGASSQAEAALYDFWQAYQGYSEPYYYYRREPRLQPRPKPRHLPRKEAVEKETGGKPQGPLIIAISIDRQQLKLYDANGLFAEAPVSTGMRGHPTPMGVFSVIQKHKFHHSNIYSGAPMPYMQRITWSGVALHAGVLPGYPGSHGCIRMPMSFAIKMWNWTRMGARVIVTPDEVSPRSFSHPLLASVKVPPPAAALDPIGAPLGHKADKAAPEIKTASSGPDLGLRPSQSDAAIAAVSANAADAAASAVQMASNTDAPGAAAAPAAPEAEKDQSRLGDPKPALKEAGKRGGQIAVFISRKDSKLYVRQNFAPLFEVPIAIAPSERPLGTHVFTVDVDKKDSNALHWSVVSLPAGTRHALRGIDEERPLRQRPGLGSSEAKPLPQANDPAEALDRLSIPSEVMAQINAMLTTGGSIIVSDQGLNQGETGEGTDFIVKIR